MTQINEELLAAYNNARFHIYSEPAVTLRVGIESIELKTLMLRHAASTAAFITAFNPYSQLLSDIENNQRNAELLIDIEQGGYKYFAGLGQDVDAKWPGEESYFVLGIDEPAAKALGMKYQQNAIVWCDSDYVPKLMLLR